MRDNSPQLTRRALLGATVSAGPLLLTACSRERPHPRRRPPVSRRVYQAPTARATSELSARSQPSRARFRECRTTV